MMRKRTKLSEKNRKKLQELAARGVSDEKICIALDLKMWLVRRETESYWEEKMKKNKNDGEV